mmetsp:Transcript_56422/g.150936  ORF Transcript_56422/g.150936 Transcript_56422/m.150936 type:complete len:99 (-) Transcript_56422:81-377(-)
MAGSAVAHHGPPVVARLASSLKFFGIIGHLIELLGEMSHASKRAPRWLHKFHNPKFGVLAIIMVIVGHLAEHVHQEHENHHQELRLAALEAQVAKKNS